MHTILKSFFVDDFEYLSKYLYITIDVMEIENSCPNSKVLLLP